MVYGGIYDMLKLILVTKFFVLKHLRIPTMKATILSICVYIMKVNLAL